jgi:hypothetical protein
MFAESRIMRRRTKQPFEASKESQQEEADRDRTRRPGMGNTIHVQAHGEVEGRRT